MGYKTKKVKKTRPVQRQQWNGFGYETVTVNEEYYTTESVWVPDSSSSGGYSSDSGSSSSYSDSGSSYSGGGE
jgi:uncharacterized membrane protein YgcG